MSQAAAGEPAPQQRRLEGSAEYESALDALFARPGRLIRIFDRELGPGYNGVRRHDALRQQLLANRDHRLRIVVHDASNLQRDCPRLMNLMRQFSHAVSINETEPQAKGVYDPFALVDERDYVHRFHYEDTRALLGFDDLANARLLSQRFEEIWEASGPAASATTLGL